MILVEGAKGERVRSLQKALKDRGFDPGDIDGDFGPATEAAVKAFQKVRVYSLMEKSVLKLSVH